MEGAKTPTYHSKVPVPGTLLVLSLTRTSGFASYLAKLDHTKLCEAGSRKYTGKEKRAIRTGPVPLSSSRRIIILLIS